MMELLTTVEKCHAETPILIGNYAHDALAAHALLEAIELADNEYPIAGAVIEFIRQNATTILARMLKETPV